jgi:hypothetical protein
MRVPMIEMRACEGKRWRLRLLPVRRSRIPMSYSTPWAWKLQAVGSRLRAPVFRFPNVCPWEVGSWTPAPSDCCCRSKCPETDPDSSRSYGLIAPAKLVGPFNCPRILLLNASRFRSLLASSLRKAPGRPFSSLMSKQSTLVRVTRPIQEAGAWFVKIVKHWFSNSLTGYHRQSRLTSYRAREAIPRYNPAGCRSYVYDLEPPYMCTQFTSFPKKRIASNMSIKRMENGYVIQIESDYNLALIMDTLVRVEAYIKARLSHEFAWLHDH